jgi:hypothetical protein
VGSGREGRGGKNKATLPRQKGASDFPYHPRPDRTTSKLPGLFTDENPENRPEIARRVSGRRTRIARTLLRTCAASDESDGSPPKLQVRLRPTFLGVVLPEQMPSEKLLQPAIAIRRV